MGLTGQMGRISSKRPLTTCRSAGRQVDSFVATRNACDAMLRSDRPRGIFLIGVQPPPTHGMAAINAAVRSELQRAGRPPEVIDLAAPSLSRSIRARLARFPKFWRGMSLLYRSAKPGDTIYMSLSGGRGQFYELAFLILRWWRGVSWFPDSRPKHSLMA